MKHRSLWATWTLVILLTACRPHHTPNPPSSDDNHVFARDAAVRDNTPDLVEVVGTAQQLMMLPSVGKLTISDHGQKQLDHGRWMILGYVSVNDTPDVLAKIRALGMKASVPRSVAERELDMQPAPAARGP